jgi:hypothetical protein
MAIKTSIGTPTANSYVSVASADEYFNGRYNSDSWLAISFATSDTATVRTDKENLLIQATRDIDKTYRFFGSKYNTGIKGQSTYQNLEFPRNDDVDVDNNLIIRDEIKYATYEQALWVIERSTQRKTEDGAVVSMAIFGKDAYNYINSYIDRTVPMTGKYPWDK